jgi:hypothetical protein
VGKVTEPKIELKNDWTKLKEAVDSFQGQLSDYWLIHGVGCDGPDSDLKHLTTIVETVPKLLDAYAELWELSMNLAAAWEQERAGISPAGLVIPK